MLELKDTADLMKSEHYESFFFFVFLPVILWDRFKLYNILLPLCCLLHLIFRKNQNPLI